MDTVSLTRGFGNVVYDSRGILYEFSGFDRGFWAKMINGWRLSRLLRLSRYHLFSGEKRGEEI
jgi:hypothetical protein